MTEKSSSCLECKGTGCMPTEKMPPTYEWYMNPGPLPCDDCGGSGDANDSWNRKDYDRNLL